MKVKKILIPSSILIAIAFSTCVSVHAEGSVIVDSIYATSLEGNLLGDPVTRDLQVYLPPGYDKATRKYPVVYLLHTGGGSDRFYPYNEFPALLDSTGLFTKPTDFPLSGFAGMVDSLIAANEINPMIIVMPDINTAYGGSFCINSALNGNYEDYIINDIVPYIDTNYRTIAERNSRAIAGHCMGGFGAVYLSMKHSDVFGALAVHSSELCTDALARACKPYIKAENPDTIGVPEPSKPFTGFMYLFSAAFSPNLANPPFYVDLPLDDTCGIREEIFLKWAAYDPIQMLPGYVSELQSLRGMYFDVGDADELQSSYFLLPFTSALESVGISHTLEVYEGMHLNKLYTRLKKSLAYLSDVLESNYSTPTEVPAGEVSGTWKLEDSPFLINGEITVPDNQTLIIEPGVEVIFKGLYKFNVKGRLLAVGIKEDNIVFTAEDQTSGWHGFHFEYIKTSNDTSKLVHCELKYGKASGTFPDDFGGAILVASCSKLIISNCYIHHNTATGGGGGIVLGYGSDPVITNNIFSYNETQYGGGLCIVDNCTPVVANNIFHNNSASIIGGGMNINQFSDPVLFNNTITNNSAGSGGGLCCRDGSDPAVVNTIIYGNSAVNGNQVYLFVANCDPHFYNCDIEDGLEGFGGPGSGSEYSGIYLRNIDTDPLFVDIATNDYHLTDISPCISVGADSIEFMNEWYYAPSNDNNGNPKPDPIATAPDIGAYESVLGHEYIPSFYENIAHNLKSGSEMVQVYPNPTSSQINIQLNNIISGATTVELIDLSGKILCSKTIATGNKSSIIDMSSFAEGLYLIKVSNVEYIVTKKVNKLD